MTATKTTIELFMLKLKKWNLLDKLTENEKESLECDLKNIAGTAIMEANNKIQNILPDFYKEITK